MTAVNISDAIISQIKAFSPIFANRVGKVANSDVFAANEKVSLQTPAAYVIPLATTTQENEGQPGYVQWATRSYAVMCVLDNKIDQTGARAIVNIEDIEQQLIQSIAGWSPDIYRGPYVFEYSGSQVIAMNGAYLWYQFEFDWTYQIVQNDVWNQDGPALQDIDASYALNGNIAAQTDITF